MKTFQSLGTRAVIPVLTLMLTASCMAQSTEAIPSQIAPSIAVVPGSQQPVSLSTTPGAVCQLHPEGMTDAKHVMNLFADTQGAIHFHVKAQTQAAGPVHMQLDCAGTDGKLSKALFQVSAGESTAATVAKPETLPIDVKRLPALTEANARALSDEDIVKLGYPLRPDSSTSPDTYAAWLKMVSKPISLVPARFVSRPDITHATGKLSATVAEGSSNWSGYELRGGRRSYDVVQGEWNVPTVYGEANTHDYSAYWVGLDGDGIGDLVQAGTEQESINILWLSFGSYYAWSELVPNQPTEQEITSFAINPGDQVFSEVWVGNSNGALNQSGGYGWFYVYDMTTGHATEYSTPLGSTYFYGAEAEWIMERPSLGGALPDLAEYLVVNMRDAYAETTAGPWVPYSASNNISITMYNSYAGGHNDNNALSEVFYDGTSEMLFFWLNFH